MVPTQALVAGVGRAARDKQGTIAHCYLPPPPPPVFCIVWVMMGGGGETDSFNCAAQPSQRERETLL